MTEEEYKLWKADPVTQDFFKLLRKSQAVLMEQWAAGGFNSEDPTVTHAANVSAVGEYKGYQKLLDLDHEQIEEGLRDESE